MKYPKYHGPQTGNEVLSMLHGQLSAAYSIIAQYEEDERRRERERISEVLKHPRPVREVPDDEDEGACSCGD